MQSRLNIYTQPWKTTACARREFLKNQAYLAELLAYIIVHILGRNVL